MNNKPIIIILIFPVCLTWLERCPFGNAQNESRPFHVICLRRVMFFLVDQSIHQGDIDFSFTRTSKELRSHEEIKCDRGILISYSVLRQTSCSQNML